MNMKKKLLLLITLLLGALSLTGCLSQLGSLEVKEDGTATIQYEILVLKEMVTDSSQTDIPSDAVISNKTVDGSEYVSYLITRNYANLNDAKTALTSEGSDIQQFKGGGILTTDTFEGYADPNSTYLNSNEDGLTQESIKEAEKLIKVEFSITMPSPIIHTNGTIDPTNPNTAKWTTQDMVTKPILTAYCETSPRYQAIQNDTKSPIIKGVKNKGIYRKATIQCTSDTGIYSITLNGKSITNNKIVYQSGKYLLVVTGINGKTSKATFYIDNKPPIIKGAKHNKTYKKSVKIKAADKYGIQSLTINGKKQSTKSIKSGIKITKNGTYKIKTLDNAGNVTTMKFRIKK